MQFWAPLVFGPHEIFVFLKWNRLEFLSSSAFQIFCMMHYPIWMYRKRY